MSYATRVIADSVSPAGVRLTTLEVTMPRFVLAEFNTHRMFSRNAASSRAIPVARRIEAVLDDPVLPVEWGKNQRGMQAREEVDAIERDKALWAWLEARGWAATFAAELDAVGLHKQLANRLIEPWAWITVVVTATEWANFFAQRCHPDAQPEFRVAAELMRDVLAASEPTSIAADEWHLPYVDDDELPEIPPSIWVRGLARLSVARCARVSTLTHDGGRDPDADVALYERLVAADPPHASPLEHVATPIAANVWCSNFRGWCQHRHQVLGGRHMREAGLEAAS